MTSHQFESDHQWDRSTGAFLFGDSLPELKLISLALILFVIANRIDDGWLALCCIPLFLIELCLADWTR